MTNQFVPDGASDAHVETRQYVPADTAGNLRSQYFDCLAAGQGACSVPGQNHSSAIANSSGDTASSGNHERALEFTNPYVSAVRDAGVTPQASPSDQALPQIHAAPADTTVPRSNWTLAINLTTTLEMYSQNTPANAPDSYAGARHKAAELLELAENTKGKPVTLVVQNAEPNPQFHSQAPKHASGDTFGSKDSIGTNNSMLVHTYIIHDGRIEELPSRPSQGVAADTQALLTTAGRQAPSEHLALFSQSHGGGPDGIVGDTGSASLEALDRAIKNGLAASGRERLDLLDFDACSMGNSRVLTALASRADRIVAAPEEEFASPHGADGQNERAIVGAVLNNPNISAAALGRTVTNIADQGLNGGEAAARTGDHKAGTPSLSNYDASKVAAFAGSVDDLGKALRRAWGQPANHQIIRDIIQNTSLSTQPGGHPSDRPVAEERDAKIFADNLLQAVNSGRIIDQDGSLKRSAQALLVARTDMVSSYHGEHKGGYDRQGGVSLFLPGLDFFNNQARANELSDASNLADMSQNPKETKIGAKDFVLESVDSLIREGHSSASAGDPSLRHLERDRAQLDAASNQEQYAAALKNIARDARAFAQTDAGKAEARRQLDLMAVNTNEKLQEQSDPTTPAWSQFLQSMNASAPEVYHN